MTAEDLDDQKLIALAQKGNRWAFGQLVKRYMRRGYFVALGFVGSPEDASDLSQEAFVRAFRNIKRFERGRKFFTWYYQILRNLCLTHLERRKRHRNYLFSEIPEEEVLDFAAGSDNSPQNHLEQKELREKLWQAIHSLSPQDREVIVLKEFQNLSYKEMAEVLQCPLGTVMSRLYYARRHLAEKMKELGWERTD